MEKIILFNDYANTQRGFQDFGLRPDFADLLDYLAEGRFLVEAHAYVPVDPRNSHGRDGEIEGLWRAGYLVHSKVGTPAGDTYKCDFDVEITLDLMRAAEIARPDIIVLMSGDKDFVPVILALRQRGIRVEVAAFADVNAAREVMLKASGFIDLGQYVDECREPAVESGESAEAAPSEPDADDADVDGMPAGGVNGYRSGGFPAYP